jgi:hypothetical protein
VNYPELTDHLLWVPVYLKSAISDFKLTRMTTDMHMRTEPGPTGNRQPAVKMMPSGIEPVSSRIQRQPLIFSTRQERDEPRARPDLERKTEQAEPLFRNLAPAFHQTACPAMRARINLSRLKMNEGLLVGFPSTIQLNLGDRKKARTSFMGKNPVSKKLLLGSAA